MSDNYVVTNVGYSEYDDQSDITISGAGMTPGEHTGRLCSWTDGVPERDWVVTHNTADHIYVHGGARGESGTHVTVDDLAEVEAALDLRLNLIDALAAWARGHLAPAEGAKDTPYTDNAVTNVYTPEYDYTTITIDSGGLTPDAEKRRCVTWRQGAPQREWLIIGNGVDTLIVRGDASGETGEGIQVDEIEPTKGRLAVRKQEIEVLRRWAAANL